MNNKVLLSLLFSLFTIVLSAQDKHDYKWLLGGSSGNDGILIDFNGSSTNVNFQHIEMQMDASNTSMCDKDGNLLFYSNGCFIANANHEVLVNGDSINIGYVQDAFCDSQGSPMPQGAISIPRPNSDSLYYLFNLDLGFPYNQTDYLAVAPIHLYTQTIDMTQDNGLGAVVEKNQVVLQDTFARGNLSATKHANGEDWWLIVGKSHSNCYFLTRITSEGIQAPITKCNGIEWNDSDAGQASFSPDGTKYARFNYQNGLHIYDFDNETGDLSNNIVINFPDDSFSAYAGLSFSSNSQFLYASARTKLYQFDLSAPDIEASKTLVAEWDGFSNPGSTLFNFSALAPDGKIYIASFSSTFNLHIIHKPNCPGIQCEVEQHGLSLPSLNYASMPNIPHYRNQPIFSECDTTITSTESLAPPEKINLYPNPTSNSFVVQLPQKSTGYMYISNLQGKEVFASNLSDIITQEIYPNLAAGLYFLNIQSENGKVFTEKLIITGQ